MRNVIIIIVIILYFANYYVLSWIYPEALNDYDVFLKFYATRNTLYEVLFFMLFVINYLSSVGLSKALSCFGMIITFASFVDKGFFNFTGYLWSDIALVLVALFTSYKVYKKWKQEGTAK